MVLNQREEGIQMRGCLCSDWDLGIVAPWSRSLHTLRHSQKGDSSALRRKPLPGKLCLDTLRAGGTGSPKQEAGVEGMGRENQNQTQLMTLTLSFLLQK